MYRCLSAVKGELSYRRSTGSAVLFVGYADPLQFKLSYNRRVRPRDFVLMKSSTKDKIKGGFKEAKGKVKEKAGSATGNPNLRDRGTAEVAEGAA